MTNTATFDFTHTRVLVTGGTSGIGHAVARGFAGAGADVIVTGTRPDAQAYDADLDGFDYRALDLSDEASIDALAQSLDALDVLVSNAGANMPDGLDEWTPDGFAASVAINLTGPMRLAARCRSLLFASEMNAGASVINVASMTAYRSTAFVPGYGSAKAGIVTLTANLAARWAGKGVRVNAIAPGLVDTPMTAPMAAIPEILDAELAHIPMGRAGRPEEVVGTVLFLASAQASYVTGHTLAVDGGYLAG